MKKVLIIAYYWPPSGGGGVQRWVKFVKYLREFGWEPVVYIPKNPDYPFIDESLLKDIPNDLEIISHKIWEPYSWYARLLGKKKTKVHAGLISDEKKKSQLSELALWVRGNFFIPDARCFWIKPSIRFLSTYLKKNSIDAVISTGPPHSMHLIARGVKRNFPNIKWLADFRDPWVHMDNNISDLKYSTKTLKKHENLEFAVLKEADKIITVSPTIAEDYGNLANRSIEIITNGFDTDDFEKPNQSSSKKNKFIIGHYGTLGKYRNPETLFEVLKELCDEDEVFNSDLAIQLVGPVDNTIIQTLKKLGLIRKLELIEYVPHSQSILLMQQASILLLLLDKNASMKGRMTGKIFEYLATSKTILGLGYSKADPSVVLNETEAGKLYEYDDEANIKKFILQSYNSSIDEISQSRLKKIEKFSRKSLTKDLADLLNSTI